MSNFEWFIARSLTIFSISFLLTNLFTIFLSNLEIDLMFYACLAVVFAFFAGIPFKKKGEKYDV